jgi:hypothetical protein
MSKTRFADLHFCCYTLNFSTPASQEVQSLKGFNYFILYYLKEGCEGVGSSKKRRFQQSSTECQSSVSEFESTSSKPVSMKCGVGSECASLAKRYGKTNLAQCSKSGSEKSVGQESIFRGEQPVNNQQSEAEDDQLTQVFLTRDRKYVFYIVHFVRI